LDVVQRRLLESEVFIISKVSDFFKSSENLFRILVSRISLKSRFFEEINN